MAARVPPFLQDPPPLPIPARSRGGKEGAQACNTSHSFLFLLLPTHQGVFTLTSYRKGAENRESAGDSNNWITGELEHNTEKTHQGNEELRLQYCPEGGEGGIWK